MVLDENNLVDADILLGQCAYHIGNSLNGG